MQKKISITKILLSVVMLLSLVGLCYAQIQASDLWSRDTLTDGFLGLNDKLTDKGVEVSFGVTNIYQQNVRGGISKHRWAGRITGSYDLELTADLQRLLGFESGSIFLHLEGGWPDTEGIDGPSVGSAFGVNADAIGNRTMDVKQLFYEGPVFSDNLTLMIGKIDFTGAFDCSAYADDECTQFLNAAFVDNPTIPFPQYSLGMALTYALTDSWYISGGMADAQADGRETGFRTTFHDEDYFLYIFETGITPHLDSANGPLQGTYRAGLWYDPQPKANSDSSSNYRDDVGLYLTCDQMLIKENDKPQDTQGLGAFFRYGYANSKRNDIANFWSLGFQYQGLIEGRDDDVLGFGFAQGFFSDLAKSTYTDDYEIALELYYSAQLAPWLAVSPSVQYIANPGGDRTASDAVVLGVRAQVSF
ncbi:MAG: carbohydrate porin [Planctomycetota bacterium]|jgi:porin